LRCLYEAKMIDARWAERSVGVGFGSTSEVSGSLSK